MRSSYSVLLAFAWPLAMRGLPCLDDKKRRRSFIFYPLEAIKALASEERLGKTAVKELFRA